MTAPTPDAVEAMARHLEDDAGEIAGWGAGNEAERVVAAAAMLRALNTRAHPAPEASAGGVIGADDNEEEDHGDGALEVHRWINRAYGVHPRDVSARFTRFAMVTAYCAGQKAPGFDAARDRAVEEALAEVPPGWSWSLGQMMGLPLERRFRCFLSDHNTPNGKAERHVCEDRASVVEAIRAAIAEATALAAIQPQGERGEGVS